jgi:hypothetical protein
VAPEPGEEKKLYNFSIDVLGCCVIPRDQQEDGRVAREQRTVKQVDQALTSFGNPGQLKSFVDGIFEL